MQDINNTWYELDYYRQRQFKAGWQDLIEVVFSGILASADDTDSRDFLRLMGSNLAKKLPLPEAETVESWRMLSMPYYVSLTGAGCRLRRMANR